MNRAELNLIQDALETVQAELEQLQVDEEWFASDCLDLIASALEIVQKEKE